MHRTGTGRRIKTNLWVLCQLCWL